MPGKAAKITLTEGQREILLTLCKSAGESPQLRQRATIILLAFDGLRNNEIAAEVGLGQRFVGRWRRRWAKGWDGLVDIECGETRADLRRAIEGILTDEPRTGARPKFSPDQITRILAVVRETPQNSGSEATHWTAHALTVEVVKRGIVASISVSQVRRYLREAALGPPLSRYRLDRIEKAQQQDLTTILFQTTN